MDQHDETAGAAKDPAKYAGAIAIGAIIALVIIRTVLEHK